MIMQRGGCDLHTHSVYSDGTLTPQELIKEAENRGLSAVALTDHNTMAGMNEFLMAAAQSTVE
ncbi:MAG: PHP domain-containing protein, partial [Clostridia bacterium]|nr:PHP domain-containing protein [Clostridia bacterium]